MKIDVSRHEDAFSYRLHPESDDPDEGRRDFSDSRMSMLLAHLEYRFELPGALAPMHPDLHAGAIWLALRPFIGSRFELPFAVSEQFAQHMRERNGVALVRVDARIAPRRAPEKVVPALLFSGGMDSMAASLVMPPDAHHLFLDRIPHLFPAGRASGLVDLARQRAACEAVRSDGKPVHITRDDHEWLFLPYPVWHSNMVLLAAIYLADSLGLGTIDSGEVLDALFFGGYHRGVSSWKMRSRPNKPAERGDEAPSDPTGGLLWILGLHRADSIGGLSEVATSIIVGKSHYRDKSFSCYYPSDGPFCMRCDKCFKKLLLRYIADDEEVPSSLVDHFLSFPYLARIFSRPYFDWHHVWFYLFQKVRCGHWFVREMQRQARQGPDLSMLEKWYPRAQIVGAYRDVVLENISKRVQLMSEDEAAALESLELPPLIAPEVVRKEHAALGAALTTGTAPAGDPDSPYSPEMKALWKFLRQKLILEPEPSLEDDLVADILLEPGRPRLSVELRGGAPGAAESTASPSVLLRLVHDPKGTERHFARLGSLALVIDASTPLDTEQRRLAVRKFVRRLGEVFTSAREANERMPA